jgi:hypothetical protein
VSVMKSARSVSIKYSSGVSVVPSIVMVFWVRVPEGSCVVSRLGIIVLMGRRLPLVVPLELTGIGDGGYLG